VKKSSGLYANLSLGTRHTKFPAETRAPLVRDPLITGGEGSHGDNSSQRRLTNWWLWTEDGRTQTCGEGDLAVVRV